MRIFCIPFEMLETPNADPRFAPITDVLAKENDIIGVNRTFYFNPNRKLLSYMKFIYYAVKTFLLGLRHSRKANLILCENVPYALIGAILSVLTRRPCIWDSHGNSLAYCRANKRSKLYTMLILAAEKIAVRFTKVMIVPSEVDKQVYVEQGFKGDKIVVIPSGIDLAVIDEVAGNKKVDMRRKLGLDINNKRILTFIGKRNHSPNMEAAEWINEELAPAIAEEFSDVQILIIGPGEIPPRIHPIVTFTGFVPNLYEYVCACDLCLAPLELDNGIFTKVIDSIACAKPVMVLPSAVNGIPQLVDGENAIIVKDRNEFIARTLDILREPNDLNRIGINARKVIEEHYNWEVLAEEWRQLVEKVMSESS